MFFWVGNVPGQSAILLWFALFLLWSVPRSVGAWSPGPRVL
jgi:hypothetical protein